MHSASYITEINEAPVFNSDWLGERVQSKQNCANKSQTLRTPNMFMFACLCLKSDPLHNMRFITILSAL